MNPEEKLEKMKTIKEEPIIEENEENNSSRRRRDKFQTNVTNKKNKLKSIAKNKRATVALDSIEEKHKIKKNIFSSKKLDQLFIKKIRETIKFVPVFDLLGLKEKNKKNYDSISHEFKKYEQKLGIILSYENRTSLNDEPPENLGNILNILSKPAENRNFNDIFVIKRYLLSTKIEWLFKDEFENKEESIEKLLTFFGLEMNYRLFKEGEEVFKVGDSSVYLYLIIKGKIEILKPTPEISYISGHEYFSYIMNLKNQKEDHLLNVNLEENYKQFDIDKNQLELLPAIYIHHVFELIKMKKKINFEEELALVNMTLKDLELTHETVHSYEHLSTQIEEKLPFVPPFLLNKYKFIVDKDTKKSVKLIKYTRVLILGNNEFFGESAMGENEKRNATIRVLEDSYIGYLSANLYKTNFFAEKKLAMQNKVHFLNTRFFLKYINLKRFSKKYFNLFVYEKYLHGYTLFRENEELNYVYFIENGLVELSSTKTMLEIEIFLKGLEEKYLLKDEENHLKYKALKSRTKDLEDYLNKTQKSKILIVGRNETLGIESFFYGIPYFVTAKIVSQRAKIFKISVEQLSQILNIEKDCISSLRNLVLNKAKILQKRLFSMNNTKLILLDNKIIFNYEFDFNNNYANKNNQEENKTEKKNELKSYKYFALTPLNISGANKKKKKNYFSQKDTIKSVKNRNHLLMNSMSDFEENDKIKHIKRRMKVLKFPSFEERWLNNTKNEIKIMNSDKQFISQVKIDDYLLNDEKENENNEKENLKEENKSNNKKGKSKNNDSNDNNIENNKQESIVIDKKSNLILDNKNKSPKLKKLNSPNDSFLPSISSGKISQKENKDSSNIKNLVNNNYSYSINGSTEKNLAKSSLNSVNNSKIMFNIFNKYSNKDNSKKPYTKLVHRKFNNFYEIKNDYDKKKIKFYNDKEIFSFSQEKKYKTIEITNFKESKNKSTDSLYLKYFNNNIQMKNKIISSKINEKTKINGDCENKY